MRVADGELGLVLSDVVEGDVLLLGLLVVNDGVSLREGSSLDVLSGNSNVDVLESQRSESESLGGRPVDVLSLLDGLASGTENPSEVLVRSEGGGEGGDDLSDLLEGSLLGSGSSSWENDLGEFLGRRESIPRRREPLLRRGLVVLGSLVSLLEHSPDPLLVLVDVGLGERSLLDESLDVLGEDGGLLLDGLVHPGLSERGLIRLVVTVFPVADDVDNDVLLELGPPVGGELTDEVDGLDVVSVDVEDGSVDGFGDVGAVRSGSRESRVGGESNLVVDDDVDGSSGSVVGERVHSHRLVDDSLSSEGGVSVKEDSHGGVVGRLVSLEVLDSSGLSEDDGVLALEMGGVGDEGKGDLLSGGSGSNVVGSEMVLDVSSSRIVVVLSSLAVKREEQEIKVGQIDSRRRR